MQKAPPVDLAPGMAAARPPFADLLRRYRAAAGLTQEELAERSGVSVRAISDLERSAKLHPQRATLQLLIEGLGLSEEERAALEASIPSRHRPPDRAVRLLDLPVGGFLGAVPEGPLVARTAELDRIRHVVETVRGGTGQLLFLSGEPGVGKTRLAQEATLICRAIGMHVATGRCYESQQTVAFYPFLETVSRLVNTAGSHLELDPLGRWPQLAPLLPATAFADAASPLIGAGDQQRLFWAVTGLVEALSGIMPLVVALDDLHWADQSSLDLLQHLARHLRHVPVLLLGTYRDIEIVRAHPLSRVLLDLHRDHLVEELAVGGLDQVGTAALLASLLGNEHVAPELVDLVYRHTEGNAFFIGEVVRTLLDTGSVVQEDGVWTSRPAEELAIPWTVQEAIGQRLAHLSPDTQAVLEAASVVGQTFEFDELQGAGEHTEKEIDAALAEAIRAWVVRVEQGERYRFNHALTQRVLYAELPPRRRKRLHLAVAKAIAQQPERVQEERAAELTWHLLEAGEHEQALHFAIIAGDQAERRFAHAEAERHYRLALKLAQDSSGPALLASLHEKLGRLLTDVGPLEEALTLLEKAGSLYVQVSDVKGEVRVTVQLGSVHRAMNTPHAGIARAEGLLRRLEKQGQPQDIAELCIVLETLYMVTGRYQDGLEVSERAAELATRSGDIAALARAKTGLGTELILLGRLEEGLQALETTIELEEKANDPYNLARAFGNASECYRDIGKLERARERAQQEVAVQERIQIPWAMSIALSFLGAACRLLGDWTAARAHLERGEKLIRTLPPSWSSTHVLLELGALCLDEDRREEAAWWIDEALAVARQTDHLEALRVGARLRAELDLREGRPESARERLEPLLDRPGLEELQVTELLVTLAAAHEACGDMQQAESTIQDAMRRARASKHMLTLASALVVYGRLMASQHNWSTAKSALAAAARLARDMPYPLLEGRALLEWGFLDRKQGKTNEARERLGKALAVFQRLGVRSYMELATQALEALQAG